jgi:hypothetical protein
VSVVATMPKKNRGDVKPGQEPNDDQSNRRGGKSNPAVKLSPRFKKRLHHVAISLNLGMGELIEREMEEFVTREWNRLKAEADQGFVTHCL